jgi:hypothetical protein
MHFRAETPEVFTPEVFLRPLGGLPKAFRRPPEDLYVSQRPLEKTFTFSKGLSKDLQKTSTYPKGL